MIYYDISLQEKVLNYMNGNLAPGGYLCIGIKEILGNNAEDKFRVMYKEENVYVKQD